MRPVGPAVAAVGEVGADEYVYRVFERVQNAPLRV